MSVRISIKNYNQPGGTLEVFRTTERLSEEQMPEPIAILDSDATEFIDDSKLLYGVDYHYATRVTTADGVVHPVTFGRKVRLSRNNGFGYQDIMSGDETLGYMGLITVDDDGYGALVSALPVTTSSFNSNVNFVKYIRNGIISYTPTAMINVASNLASSTGKVFGGSARDVLIQNASVLKLRDETSGMKTVFGSEVFSVHIPVIYREGDTVDPNFFADTPDSEFNSAPPGKWEALDYWRMFSPARMTTDARMAPVNFNFIGGTAMYYSGNQSPTSAAIGTMTFVSRSVPPRVTTSSSYTTTSGIGYNFIIEHESTVG